MIHLVCTNGTMTVNGDILACGQSGTSNTSARQTGAGGSVWLEAGAYNGTGTIDVRGGAQTANQDRYGCGGSGRVALYTRETSFHAFNPSGIRVFAGPREANSKGTHPNKNAHGGGTIYREHCNHTPGCGDLIIDGGDVATISEKFGTVVSQYVDEGHDEDAIFNSVSIQNQGRLIVSDGQKIRTRLLDIAEIGTKGSYSGTIEIVSPHTFGEWTTNTYATCTNEGYEVRICTDAECGVAETNVLAALGHAWGAWVTNSVPTYMAEGERQRTCERPDCGVTETEVIPMLVHAHTFGEWETVVAPACTNTGYEVRTCQSTDCTIPPAAETNILAALGHDWGEWVTNTVPTETTEGERQHTCLRTDCGVTEKEVIPPLGPADPVTMELIVNGTFDTVLDASAVKPQKSFAGLDGSWKYSYTGTAVEYRHAGPFSNSSAKRAWSWAPAAYAGAYSCGFSGYAKDYLYCQVVVPVTDKYTFSYVARRYRTGTYGKDANFNVYLENAATKDKIELGTCVETTTTWNEHKVTDVTIPAGTYYLVFYLNANSYNAIDNVSLSWTGVLKPVTLDIICDTTKQTYAATTNNVPVTTSVLSNQLVKVVATPVEGYEYTSVPTGWAKGVVAGTITTNLVATADPTQLTIPDATARPQWTLTLVDNPSGTISGATSGVYYGGTALTLTATPNEGWLFGGWTVNGESAGFEPTLKVTMDADKTIAAQFYLLACEGDVRITEFAAKNKTSFTSACGKKECDWIELTNYSTNIIQLAGWGLTSKSNTPYMVTIPQDFMIRPGESKVVVCGDTTEICAKGELHVALSLSKDAGKFVGLCDTNGTWMTAIKYPVQMTDITYGYGYRNPSDPAAELEELYFKLITPGAANTNRGYTVKTPEVVISVPHGYKSEPVDVEISCPDKPDAAIYYTTNGVAPTTSDTLYTGPIHIEKTTCLRAGVPDPDTILQHDASATYIYLEDVLAQPSYRDNTDYDGRAWSSTVYDIYRNLGFPQSRKSTLGSQYFHYGFDQKSLAIGDMRQRTLEGMTNGIDTISIVIDPANLFNKDTGIYVKAYEDGRDWERQTMVECVCPTNSANDFSLSAGLRIRGGSSRQYMYPKHSFRLYFRGDYGVDALEKPIFGDERGAATKFSKIDLRTSQNWSVAGDKSKHDTFIHETFLRDAQGKLGQPYTRSRYYHLYINGIYWGLYETQERGDEDYAESYLGGDADDYDVIKRSTDYIGSAIQGASWDIAAGNKTAYNQLCALAKEGFVGANSNNYLKAMGRNPDGTRNLEYPILLDDDNLMAYVLINHYVNNNDSAFSRGTGSDASLNNLYAMRNRVDDETGAGHNGFIFLCHDGEHTFGTDTTFDVLSKTNTNQTRKVSCHYTGDRTLGGTTAIAATYGNAITSGLFGPAELNYKLMQNDEYRMKFADLVYRTCLKEGGVLTISGAKKIFTDRMAQIDNAIAAEYARWNWANYPLPTYDTWTNACAECFEFIDKRLDYLIPQYRSHGWYPLVDAPTAAEEAGTVTLATTNAEWTIYYTTDGSDPRLAGGATNGAAQVYTASIPVGEDDLALRARVVSASGEWSALETLDVKGAAPDLQAVNVRWWGFCGQPDVGDDGDGEFIILTNINASAAVSLEGLEIRICKTGDAAAKCQFTLGADVSIEAGGFIRLNHADYPKAVGWEKITNGNVDLRLKSAQGTAFNEFAALSQKSLGVQASGKFAVRDFKDDISWTTMAIADAPGGTQPTPPPGPQPGGDVISGDFPNGTNIVLTAATTLKLGDATFGKPLTISGAAATLELQAGTTATIPAINASGIALTIDGAGTLTLSGTNTLITSTDFIVSNGVLNLTFTNAAAKACAVNLLGNFKQYGGTVNLALESANQVYGFYCNVKDKSAKIHGGVLNATIDGGESSAAFKLNKGSNDFEFKGGAVNVTLGGRAPRFVNADGEIKFDGSRVTIETMKNLAETSRVFKCAKDLTIKDGVVTGKAKGLGSEIFSADGMIKVKGGVVSVEADDDCFSAGTNLVVSAGKVQALSYNGDAIDSNGPMTISGGYVFATTLSPLHEGLDVYPKDGGSANKLLITGGSVVAAGGANNLHAPDVGSVACYTNANITSMKKYLVLTGKRKSTVTKLSVNLESGKKRNADGFSLIATVPNQVGTYTDTKTKPSEDTPKGVKLDDDLDGVFLTIYSTATLLTIQ